jgi:hypothetical protein
MIDNRATKAILNTSGLLGSKTVLPLDVDKCVTSVDMKVGDYTIAAQPTVPCRITATVTATDAADTMGTIVIVGDLPDGTEIEETITPAAGKTVSTVNEFKKLTTVTGVGWVTSGGADKITIGMGAVVPESYFVNAIPNRIVTSTNMKVGAYTVANQPYIPSKITVKSTAAGTADTMGTITIEGIDENDIPKTETLTPISGSTVTSETIFKTVFSVTGAGWVIDGGNDTIMVGTAEVKENPTHCFGMLQALVDTVVADQEDVTGTQNAELKGLTKIPAGATVIGKFASVTLTSGELIAYLASI